MTAPYGVDDDGTQFLTHRGKNQNEQVFSDSVDVSSNNVSDIFLMQRRVAPSAKKMPAVDNTKLLIARARRQSTEMQLEMPDGTRKDDKSVTAEDLDPPKGWSGMLLQQAFEPRGVRAHADDHDHGFDPPISPQSPKPSWRMGQNVIKFEALPPTLSMNDACELRGSQQEVMRTSQQEFRRRTRTQGSQLAQNKHASSGSCSVPPGPDSHFRQSGAGEVDGLSDVNSLAEDDDDTLLSELAHDQKACLRIKSQDMGEGSSSALRFTKQSTKHLRTPQLPRVCVNGSIAAMGKANRENDGCRDTFSGQASPCQVAACRGRHTFSGSWATASSIVQKVLPLESEPTANGRRSRSRSLIQEDAPVTSHATRHSSAGTTADSAQEAEASASSRSIVIFSSDSSPVVSATGAGGKSFTRPAPPLSGSRFRRKRPGG